MSINVTALNCVTRTRLSIIFQFRLSTPLAISTDVMMGILVFSTDITQNSAE